LATAEIFPCVCVIITTTWLVSDQSISRTHTALSLIVGIGPQFSDAARGVPPV
jgi:hypothetical protein